MSFKGKTNNSVTILSKSPYTQIILNLALQEPSSEHAMHVILVEQGPVTNDDLQHIHKYKLHSMTIQQC